MEKADFSIEVLPVIDDKTRRRIGEAKRSDVIASNMKGNYPIIELGARAYACSLNNTEILVYTDRSPFVY